MKISAVGILLLVALLSSACHQPLTPEKDLLASVERFSQALRWHDFSGASRYFLAPLDEEFRRDFGQRADLNITDAQMTDLSFESRGDSAQVGLLIEYYLLPSASLRQLRIQQHWRLDPSGSWRLSTPLTGLD